MSDGAPDPNELISEVTKVLAEPINNILSPPTKEIGELLGTIANLCRFYATENLASIFKEWAKYRRGERLLNGDDLRKVIPLLPSASMVRDDELQEKWARLMESTVNGDGRCAAFGQTLSQLSPLLRLARIDLYALGHRDGRPEAKQSIWRRLFDVVVWRRRRGPLDEDVNFAF
jgi:hypothetical protein